MERILRSKQEGMEGMERKDRATFTRRWCILAHASSRMSNVDRLMEFHDDLKYR